MHAVYDDPVNGDRRIGLRSPSVFFFSISSITEADGTQC